MNTIQQSLKSISAYPIPFDTIKDLADENGLDHLDEATQQVRASKEFKLTKAALLRWLSNAPDISQGGVSYSFSEVERRNFKMQAQWLDRDCGVSKTIFGYKGSRL